MDLRLIDDLVDFVRGTGFVLGLADGRAKRRLMH